MWKRRICLTLCIWHGTLFSPSVINWRALGDDLRTFSMLHECISTRESFANCLILSP